MCVSTLGLGDITILITIKYIMITDIEKIDSVILTVILLYQSQRSIIVI